MKNQSKKLNILALEPFYGGSHKSFIDQLIKHSAHNWKLLTLPEEFWRWRTRSAALDFADQIENLNLQANDIDLIFATSLVNTAELRGLLPRKLATKKIICYFHENQLAYPVPEKGSLHQDAALANIKTALSSDINWFNSKFNLNSFLKNIPSFSKILPNPLPSGLTTKIAQKSEIVPLGIELPQPVKPVSNTENSLHIVWAARWEHDKNFKDFFKALIMLEENRVDFKLSVLGESGLHYQPKEFNRCRKRLDSKIINWGYAQSKEKYFNQLADADIFVSSANHEFFGIAAVEAAGTKTIPLLPDRLAYPEIFSKEFLYDNTPEALCQKLLKFIKLKKNNNQALLSLQEKARETALKYSWQNSINHYDSKLQTLTENA